MPKMHHHLMCNLICFLEKHEFYQEIVTLLRPLHLGLPVINFGLTMNPV